MNITAGKYKGQKIIAPDENITRPTLSKVRMSVFNTLQAMITFEDSTFLDMFSGSGIMALEALSRGFKSALAFENNKKVYKILSNNTQKYPDIKILFGDSLKLIDKIPDKYEVIYIDPPYYCGVYEKSLELALKVCSNVIILEHVIDFDLSNYNVIKQKKYGDKFISFIEVLKNKS